MRLAPRAHHKRVVVRNARHHVDAPGLDFFQMRHVARDVLDGARGGQGTGHGEENDFLVDPLFAGVVGYGHTAGVDCGVFGSVGDIAGGHCW